MMIIPAQLGFIQVCSFPLQTYNIIQVRMQDFKLDVQAFSRYFLMSPTDPVN